jgi:hypothetical protein
MGSLPETMSVVGTDVCSWIPVDVLSKAILEIDFDDLKEGETSSLVYNLVHPRTFFFGERFPPCAERCGDGV